MWQNCVCRTTYKQLGLLTYFTTGEKESRAWTIQEGMTAPQAAGVIHTGAVLVLAGGVLHPRALCMPAHAPHCQDRSCYKVPANL